MIRFDSMAAEFGGWWPMSPWLSPGAAWFIFFNVVVGAIAVMSRAHVHDAPPAGNRRRLSRTASTLVLDSLRSISLFSFPSGAAGGGDDSVPYYSPPAPLHQDPRCAFQEPEAHEATSCRVAPPKLREREPAPASAPAAAECKEEDAESISLDEAYALARARREPAAAAANNTVAKEEVPRKKRGPVMKLEEVKGRYGCGRGVLEEVEGKAEVNARAEQFIRQFREELKLERINSILNYTRALRRAGATVAAGAATNRLV